LESRLQAAIARTSRRKRELQLAEPVPLDGVYIVKILRLHYYSAEAAMFKLIRAIVVYLASVFAVFIVLFGLLAFLAWEAMGPNSKKMNIDVARTEIGLLEDALETYHKDVGSYAPNLDALRVEPVGLPPGKWDGPYLNKDVPPDPWGKPYQYSRPGKHNPDGFDLWTVTPEGQEIGNLENKEYPDRARMEVGILAEAVKKYHDTAGSSPPNLRALLEPPEVLPAVKWAGPYLDTYVPMDPWGNPYHYTSQGKHNPDNFDLWAVSPDGQEIGNWIRDESPAGSGRMPPTRH
jgi:general secretion pathway protein G